jgi:hypothetical protein
MGTEALSSAVPKSGPLQTITNANSTRCLIRGVGWAGVLAVVVVEALVVGAAGLALPRKFKPLIAALTADTQVAVHRKNGRFDFQTPS